MFKLGRVFSIRHSSSNSTSEQVIGFKRVVRVASPIVTLIVITWFPLPGSSQEWNPETPTAKSRRVDFEKKKAEARERAMTAFVSADKDLNNQLSHDEYVANRGELKVATRDFTLFDVDGDEGLSKDEFLTIPTVIEPRYRVDIADPMDSLVDSVQASLDKALGGWDETPEREIKAGGFMAAFTKRFPDVLGNPKANRLLEGQELVGGKEWVDTSLIDVDQNGMVSRKEVRRYLEIQLGVRRLDGKLLRLPNGWVVNNNLYLFADKNRNDRIDKNEYTQFSFAGERAPIEFEESDLDGNGELSFEEWCSNSWRGVSDAISEFRNLDENLDAFVDRDEILKNSAEWLKPLANNVFPGFDLDQDKRLSLDEYRLTMQANMVLPWHHALQDSNGDGTLVLTEFIFSHENAGRDLFPLLRLIYFKRLDTSGNNKLEPNEFTFTVKQADEFFTLREDGSEWKPLFKFEGHNACGSPSISADGKWLAFDAFVGGQQAGSTIFVKKIDGTEPSKPQQVCSGMMPNWSAEGLRLTSSRSSPQYGVWIIDLAGEDHKYVCPGWGAQWSPDGRRIVFTEGSVIKAYNVESEETTTLLAAGGENPYRQIYWNIGWSPDSKRLCFKGTTQQGVNEVATINATADKPDLKVRYSTNLGLNADFSWHPNGHRVVFSAHSSERKKTQLFEFDPDHADAPVLFKGQDEKRNNTDHCWTPDGKLLIIVSGDY